MRRAYLFFPLLVFLGAVGCFRHELPPPPGVSEVVVRFSAPGEVESVEPALGFLGTHPYVFYYHGVSGELRVATPATTAQGTGWKELKIVGSSTDPRGRGIRVWNRDGRFHLVYQDSLTGNLHYTVGVPGQWTHITPLPPGDRREPFDFGLDTHGVPWIAYRNATQGGVEVVFLEGSTWTREIVDTRGSSGYSLRIGIDPAGRKYIVYSDASEGVLRMSWGRGGGEEWVTEVVESGLPRGASWISLSMGPLSFTDITQIYPRILYYDKGKRILKYAEKQDMNKPWRIEVVDPQPFRGSDNSLIVDPRGVLWISYLDGTELDLYLGRRNQKDWNLWVEDSSGAVGFRSQLAQDSKGNLSAVYLRNDTRELLYHRITRWE